MQRRKARKDRWRQKFLSIHLFVVFFVFFVPLCEKMAFQVKRLKKMKQSFWNRHIPKLELGNEGMYPSC